MALIRSARKADVQFQVDGGPADKLLVAKMQGVEEVSRPFHFRLELASTDGAVDFDSVVGKPGLITIAGPSGTRYVHGVVARFEQITRGKKYSTYEAELVPDIWLMGHRAKSRIFQNMSVEDIVKKVLEEDGIATDRFRFSLKGSYSKRDYCVQYRESDLNFVSRLLEGSGIYYFFEHKKAGHTLVMADSPDGAVPLEGGDKLKYRPPGGGLASEEHVDQFRLSQEVRSGKAVLRSYNFVKPSMNLEVENEADIETDLEVYDYPGGYMEPGPGNEAVGKKLERIRATRVRATGEGTCRWFVPGYRLSLDEHPRKDFNAEYFLLRVEHEASQPQVREEEAGEKTGPIYRNRFQGIPSDVTYRPACITPRPTVKGTQTAVVVGPSGEEIYTDEHGRVKVQFHWDREGTMDEKSSCWIRVSQGWAGSGWGAVFLPRIGQEVIVDFLEGNPNRPIVTGRVYHGTNKPPYTLPDDKTKSTIKSDSSKGGGGSNELRFEDKKGEEEVFIHAQKDMNENIENDMSTSVGASQSISVGGNRSISVSGTHTETIKGNTSVTVSEGTYEHKVNTGTATISVKGDVAETFDATQKTTVNGDIAIKSKSGKIDVSGATEIKLSVGGSSLTLKSDGTIELKGVNVTVDGSASVKIHGAAVSSEADANHTTKGAMVLSEASATNTIKGAMVLMNP